MIHQRRKSDLKNQKSHTHREWPTVARQKEKRAALLDKSGRGIAIFDINYEMIDCNTVFADMLDLPPSLRAQSAAFMDVMNHRVESGDVPGNDGDHYVTKHLNIVRNASVENLFETLPDGRVLSVGYIPVETGGFITTLDDVSDIYAIKDELEHAGFYDRRTSLPNERVLLRCIDEAYAQSWEEEYFALITIQVTNFNALAERHGEEAGHELLRQIGGRIRNCVRKEDLSAKLKGAEFAVLEQSVTDPQNAEALASRLISQLNMPYDLAGRPVLVEFALGIALPNAEDDREETLLANARAAAATASGQIGQRYAFYVADHHALSA